MLLFSRASRTKPLAVVRREERETCALLGMGRGREERGWGGVSIASARRVLPEEGISGMREGREEREGREGRESDRGREKYGEKRKVAILESYIVCVNNTFKK